MTVPAPPEGHQHWTMELADEVLGEDVRYREVLDGELFVPLGGASLPHQLAVSMVMEALFAHRPDGLAVLGSPTDVAMPWGDVCQPDVLAIRLDTIEGTHGLTAAPELVVEVLSPSNRRNSSSEP